MAAYLEALHVTARDTVGFLNPDIPADGIWEARNAAMVPWADLIPPYAALVMTPRRSEQDSALDWQVYRFPLDIYLVLEITGDSEPLRARMEALRDYLFANDLVPAQVIGVDDLEYDENLPNDIFAEKGLTYRAGRLRAMLQVG